MDNIYEAGASLDSTQGCGADSLAYYTQEDLCRPILGRQRTKPGIFQGWKNSLWTILFASSTLGSQVLLLATEFSFRVRQAYRTLELKLRSSSSHEMHRAFIFDISMLCDPSSKLHPPVLALIYRTSRVSPDGPAFPHLSSCLPRSF